MRYAIRHLTRFDYAWPVRFARCNLRLHPIDWEGQVVEQHGYAIEPGGRVARAAQNGYPAITDRLVIERPASSVGIESRSTVRVDRVAPAARADDATVAEAGRAAREAADLAATAPANYLYPSPLIGAFPAIAAWCGNQLAPDRGVVEAGLALAEAIRAHFRYDGSATALDTSPADAFAARRGVCQDFAQIMISGARSAGIAAAYVSGYLRTVPPPGQARLVGADATHAWAMLWCGPARGWLGFDPTNGVAVGPDHIVAAIGRDYADVAPIDGVFLGTGEQTIAVEVDVEVVG